MGDTTPLSNSAVFLTAYAVGQNYGYSAYRARRHITPDAWIQSGKSDKFFPVFLPATVEAFLKVQAEGDAA